VSASLTSRRLCGLALALLVAAGIALTIASTQATAEPQKPLTVKVKGSCSTDPVGINIDIYITNPDIQDALREIVLFSNGEEIFGEIDFAPPGTSVKHLGPFPPNDKFRVVVRWEGEVYADKTLNLDCR
jgi:hypothetical protein